MKLKKIASLALAGVMAVSMLAGCAGGNNDNNSSSGDNGSEVVPASAVVNMFNSKQSVTNTVKVEFTADAKLEKAIQDAIDLAGAGAAASTVMNNVKYMTGVNYKTTAASEATGLTNALTNLNKKWSSIGIYDKANNAPVVAKVKDGTTNTWMLLVSVTATPSIQSPETALNTIFNTLNSRIFSQLDDDSFAGATKTPGTDYLDYSYTGTACAVTSVNTSGTPVYYIAMTLTQDVATATTPKV